MMGCSEHVSHRTPFGKLYDANGNFYEVLVNEEEAKWRETETHGDVVPRSLDCLRAAADFCCQVGTHHWGINEWKNTLKQMFILICRIQTNKQREFVANAAGCSAVVAVE